MEVKNNVIYFNTDDEIIDYVLNVDPTIYSDDTGLSWYDYEFTDQYKKDRDNGIIIAVNDPESKVIKRGCVYRGVVTKKVPNLLRPEYLD